MIRIFYGKNMKSVILIVAEIKYSYVNRFAGTCHFFSFYNILRVFISAYNKLQCQLTRRLYKSGNTIYVCVNVLMFEGVLYVQGKKYTYMYSFFGSHKMLSGCGQVTPPLHADFGQKRVFTI